MFFYHLDLIIKDLQGEILWFYGFQSSNNNRRRFQEQTQDLMETETERSRSSDPFQQVHYQNLGFLDVLGLMRMPIKAEVQNI